MLEHNISNKDLTIFLLVTFGLTIGMGIAMAFTYTKYPMKAFVNVQMYYPAIGVMISLLLTKERRKKLPMKFYASYLFFTITSVFIILIGIFVFHKDPEMYIEYWISIGSVTTFLMVCFPDEKEKMYNFGLEFEKKVKASIGYIMLFFILYTCKNVLLTLILCNVKEIINVLQNTKMFMLLLVVLPISFVGQFIAFLGEEYGWRYFLQNALQQRLGKRKGIIILGVIWGIWHLPINLFYNDGSIAFYSILNQLIACILYGIFYGFVYMKTENIWTISIIHYLNNTFIYNFNGSNLANPISYGKFVLVQGICMCVVYLPFLFTKEYRKSEEELELTNEL